MKITPRSLIPVFVLVLLALSAVGVASAQNFTDIAGTIRSAVPSGSASEREVTGPITSITPETWTVDGVEFQVLPQTEVKGAFVVGDVVTVHLVSAADGSLTAREVEFAETGVGNDNGNENGNENDDDNGNVNDNDNDDVDDDDNGNVNDNDNDDNDDHGNVNDNDNDDDDDHGNTNDNDNDDHGGDDNGNGNGDD